MKSRQLLALAGLVVVLSACFQQVVNTGRPAGATTVDQKWVSTWIFGLVEAKPIDVRAQCPQGVARVRTGQSFLNGLAGGLTLGIWTPQEVSITCASGSASLDVRFEIHVAAGASSADRIAALHQAIETSRSTREDVLVRF